MPTTTSQLETVLKTPSGVRVSFLATLLLFAGWLTTVVETTPHNPLVVSLNNTARFPFDYSTHAGLSQVYLDMMRLELAGSELSVAKDYTPDVLGESDTSRLNEQLTSLPHKTGAALTFWKEIASKYPEYSASLIQQIYLYYNSGDLVSAQRHANTLKFLDNRSFEKLPEELRIAP